MHKYYRYKLNSTITINELDEALNNAKNSTPGLDKIPYFVLITLPSNT